MVEGVGVDGRVSFPCACVVTGGDGQVRGFDGSAICFDLLLYGGSVGRADRTAGVVSGGFAPSFCPLDQTVAPSFTFTCSIDTSSLFFQTISLVNGYLK